MKKGKLICQTNFMNKDKPSPKEPEEKKENTYTTNDQEFHRYDLKHNVVRKGVRYFVDNPGITWLECECGVKWENKYL